MKKYIFAISISAILLVILVVDVLNINDIKNVNSLVGVVGEQTLELKKNYDKIGQEHVNIKGTVEEINNGNIKIKLSNYSKTYLNTEYIIIKDEAFNLKMNERVFLKFYDLNIEKNIINYSSVELYKLANNIEITNEKNDFIVCKNYDGKKFKIEGKSFKYNDNIYFKSNYDLTENNEEYFINVKNGNLLTEKYKSLKFPFKIYNMINPQETRFDEVIEMNGYKK